MTTDTTIINSKYSEDQILPYYLDLFTTPSGILNIKYMVDQSASIFIDSKDKSDNLIHDIDLLIDFLNQLKNNTIIMLDRHERIKKTNDN